MHSSDIKPYAPAIIKLLQGVVYYDDVHWDLLLNFQTPIEEYFGNIGLQLYINEGDGYAFVRQPELESEEGKPITLPRLIRRYHLDYQTTLLCVLLRERLDQFDAANLEANRLLLTKDELRDLLRPFVRERSDERRLLAKFDLTINRVVEYGFLRQLTTPSEERFEVRRVLRAKIDSDKIAELKEKLAKYVPDEA